MPPHPEGPDAKPQSRSCCRRHNPRERRNRSPVPRGTEYVAAAAVFSCTNQVICPVGPPPVFLTVTQSVLPSPLKSTTCCDGGSDHTGRINGQIRRRHSSVSPIPRSVKRSVHVPFAAAAVMPPKVVLSDVVAGGLVTPGPPETTVLLVLVGIRVALEAVVHQFAVALSAKVYVLVLTRSFDPNGGVKTVPQSFVLVEPVLPKSRRLGVPLGARSDTSRSLTHVCLALKLTSTDDTVPVNPDTVKVTSLGSPPGLPQVGVPVPSANMPNVRRISGKCGGWSSRRNRRLIRFVRSCLNLAVHRQAITKSYCH